jgi:dihydroneopterin aldolase
MIVFIDRLRIHGPIGWFDHEREVGVELFVSVRVDYEDLPNNDDLIYTIDYLALAKIVENQSAVETKLLETLAENCIKAVLNEYRHLKIKEIKIKIEKSLQRKIGLPVDVVGIEKTYCG